MSKVFRSNHPIRQIKSFKHAFDGVTHAWLHEPNFRIQIIIVALASYFGKRYKITNTEWSVMIITLGLLLAAEIINTVVEEIMDHFTRKEDPAVKIIKDLSAGFVLVFALTASAILYLIFAHRIQF
ncbi:MAG: diacylglycerol kinase family protein [Patescibacteria group bacterium]